MKRKYQSPELKVFPNCLISPVFTQYLLCAGPIPADCNRDDGKFDFVCRNRNRVEGSFILPGLSCAEASQCTVTINGQPAADFCGGAQQFTLGPGIDCGGGCFYEPSCDILNGACAGGELVEVQCPSFTGCQLTLASN